MTKLELDQRERSWPTLSTRVMSSASAVALIFQQCRGIRILSYHGLVERIEDSRLERNFHTIAEFRNHVSLLRHLRVYSLAELEHCLDKGALPKRGVTIVVTFDDGYANNLVAAEVLAEARLPWAVFVTTGPLDGGSTIWTAELSLLLLHGRISSLRLFDATWSLESREDREIAFQSIRSRLKALPAGERIEAVRILRSQYSHGELAYLLERFPSFAMMRPDQLTSLANAGVEVGSHGVHHEVHHARQPRSVRMAELEDSKRRIVELTERECRYFAYPNGNAESGAPVDVRSAGFALAFTTEPGTVTPDSNPWLLPRIEPKRPLAQLAKMLRSP